MDALVPHSEHQNIYTTGQVWPVWLHLGSWEICLGLFLTCGTTDNLLRNSGIPEASLTTDPSALLQIIGHSGPASYYITMMDAGLLKYPLLSVRGSVFCHVRLPSIQTPPGSSSCSSLTPFLLRYLPPDLL